MESYKPKAVSEAERATPATPAPDTSTPTDLQKEETQTPQPQSEPQPQVEDLDNLVVSHRPDHMPTCEAGQHSHH